MISFTLKGVVEKFFNSKVAFSPFYSYNRAIYMGIVGPA